MSNPPSIVAPWAAAFNGKYFIRSSDEPIVSSLYRVLPIRGNHISTHHTLYFFPSSVSAICIVTSSGNSSLSTPSAAHLPSTSSYNHPSRGYQHQQHRSSHNSRGNYHHQQQHHQQQHPSSYDPSSSYRNHSNNYGGDSRAYHSHRPQKRGRTDESYTHYSHDQPQDHQQNSSRYHHSQQSQNGRPHYHQTATRSRPIRSHHNPLNYSQSYVLSSMCDNPWLALEQRLGIASELHPVPLSLSHLNLSSSLSGHGTPTIDTTTSSSIMNGNITNNLMSSSTLSTVSEPNLLNISSNTEIEETNDHTDDGSSPTYTDNESKNGKTE